MSSRKLFEKGSRRPRQRLSDIGEPKSSTSSVDIPQFRGKPHRGLTAIVLSLCAFGLLAVFSASAPEALHSYHDATYYLRKQTIACMVGILLMFGLSYVEYEKFKRFAWPLAILACISLVLTLIPGISTTSFGSSRWIPVGPFQFQPSELAKVSVILLMATGLSNGFWYQGRNLKRLLVVGLMCAIVLKQPDLGSTGMLCVVTGVIMFTTGFNLLFTTLAICFGFVGAAVKVMHTPYQMARIKSWLDPFAYPQNEGWNIIQAQLAIGSGGWLGVGFGQSLQKLHYLPVQHADFIFAVIAEELGFVGAMVIVMLFAAFGYFGFTIAQTAQTLFGRLLAMGITSLICVQALINIMVTTGILPITGITLPFISYGGSSMVITLAAVGILLSVSRDRKDNAQDLDDSETDSENNPHNYLEIVTRGSLIRR